MRFVTVLPIIPHTVFEKSFAISERLMDLSSAIAAFVGCVN